MKLISFSTLSIISAGFFYYQSIFASSDPSSAVDRDFLLTVLSKLREGDGSLLIDDTKEWSDKNQQAFINKLRNYNFGDFFAKPKTKNDKDIFSYNILNQRNWQIYNSDKQNTAFKKCRAVYTKDEGLTFKKVGLKNIGNPLPKGYEDAWSFSYCAGFDHNRDNERILYFFHGLSGGPMNFWNRRAISEVRQQWRKHGRLPKWVAVSVGRKGMLSESGMEERFMKIVVPYVEKQLGFTQENKPKQRFVLGVSMGGANATNLVQKQSLFDAAFLVCPAVSVINPKSSNKKIWSYSRRTGAYFSLVSSIYTFMPYEFSDEDYYNKVDPLIAGQLEFGKHTAPMYIQTSSKDQFGFQEGGRLLAMIARMNGADVTFEELEGKHCMLEPQSIVNFFTSHTH